MKKKELIERVTDALRAADVRKPIALQRHVFTITDDDGTSAKFVVRRKERDVIYTIEDATNIIDACLAVIIDAIKHGEDIEIRGFGTIGVHKRAARRTKEPNTGEWCVVEERYVPKFTFGKDMRMAARVYELSLGESSEPINLDEEDDT